MDSIKNDKYMFIFDNASIHVSKLAKSYLAENKIKAMTISPYSPWLNPTEKLIGAIKAKIRKEMRGLK
jgi:transposase